MSGTKTNLNVYYSDSCNMKCSYCCMGEIENRYYNSLIRRQIDNNTFPTEVRIKCQELGNVTLGIWGREPSINQDKWEHFITQVLETDTSIVGQPTDNSIPDDIVLYQEVNVKGIFVPTNGLEFDYDTWAQPLINFCNTHQKKIKLWIQFSIDDPKPQTAINTLLKCCDKYQTNEYFKLKLSTKSTLTNETLYQDIDKWYGGMAALKDICQRKAQAGCDVSLVGAPPTLARPGNYTKEDGIQWARWHVPILSEDPVECAAGNTSFTMTAFGECADCQLIKWKEDSPLLTYDIFLQQYNQAVAENNIPSQDPIALYNAITTQYCWAVSNPETDLMSYINVWGNGALEGA